MKPKTCVACGGPVERGYNVCRGCRDKAEAREERRRAEKAILHEFAVANLAEPCSDGDRILGHPGGMHTNGGCRCGRNEGGAQVIWLGRLRRMLAAMAAEIYELRQR
jgi:predicted nucleic acid-binding Zn ribbon protein